MKPLTLISGKAVYIVLECAYEVNCRVGENLDKLTYTEDAKIHGVYTTRDIALAKMESLREKPAHLYDKRGYLCVLKKSIQGPQHQFTRSK